jgi:hypothetical protein
MPQYLMLIYSPADRGVSDQPPEVHERWNAYTQSLKDAGVYVGGGALQSVETATTLRERDGQVQITDGPFAETKEALGGYYLVDAPDLDTVLELAKSIPNLPYGSLEVRPIWDLE